MFDGRWRKTVDRRTTPVGKGLVRIGITADVLTATGLVFAVATAVAVATGHPLLGVPLLIMTGLPDLFDGPVAKASGTASIRGAFFDSVSDRVSDAILMGGVSWYLISAHKGHTAILPLAVLGVTSLVSYQRSKAEALGLSGAKGGLMERAERMILLGVGFLASWLLVPVLWALLGLTTLTAIGRFARVWNVAVGPEGISRAEAIRANAPTDTDGEIVLSASARWRQGLAEGRLWARREGSVPRTTSGYAGETFARRRSRRTETVTMRGDRARRTRRTAQKHSGRTVETSERRSLRTRGFGRRQD